MCGLSTRVQRADEFFKQIETAALDCHRPRVPLGVQELLELETGPLDEAWLA
jgi:hypothetical protein